MTRVSENSNTATIGYALTKTKRKLEDLQMKGASLKRIVKPSDDPIGNVDLIGMRSRLKDNDQMKRNISYAQTYLEFSENAVAELTDIMNKAKEIAIAQSSDTYNPGVRKNIAREVDQLRNQAMSIANKRLGNKYIFAGYKTQQKPFDENGGYHGDGNNSFVEITKDFFVPISLNGEEVFFSINKMQSLNSDPLADVPELKTDPADKKSGDIKEEDKKTEEEIKRDIASLNNERTGGRRESIFDQLDTLKSALMSGSAEAIQNLLEGIDESTNRLITLRTKLGSIMKSVIDAEGTIDTENLVTEKHKSKIQDADIAELFSELEKQKNIMEATYKSTGNIVNTRLIDFLR